MRALGRHLGRAHSRRPGLGGGHMSAPGVTLRAALGYAAAGWRPFPFPFAPGSMTSATPCRFKGDASDLERIRTRADAERSSV
jgi:hypothetical protein